MNSTKKAKSRFSFRLQTTLVVITALCLAMGLVANELNKERQKRLVVEKTKLLGGLVRVHHRGEDKSSGIVNGYLRVILGDEYFTEVDYASLQLKASSDIELLHALQSERLIIDVSQIVDEGLSRLSELRCKHLSVVFQDTTIGEKTLIDIAGMPSLESLEFQNCTIERRSLVSLEKSRGISGLILSQCKFENGAIEPLKRIDCRNFSVQGGSLSDQDLLFLHGSPSVRYVSLLEVALSDKSILALRLANPGWTINFSVGPSFNGRQMNSLPSIEDLPKETTIHLRGSNITDEVLNSLSIADSLQELYLTNCAITDLGLGRLSSLKQLKLLSIADSPISDAGLQNLSKCDSLETLWLVQTRVSGSGFDQLPHNLKSISWGPGITDTATVRHLSRFTDLNHLQLVGPLRDDCLDVFEELGKLASLTFYGAKFTQSRLIRTQQLLPQCEISVDGRLVSSTPTPSGP